MISRGEPIPPLGTPGSSPIHTEIHIAYLKSPKIQFTQQDMQIAQQLSQQAQGEGGITGTLSKITRQSPAIQLLVHILGEMIVQKARMGAATEQQGKLTPQSAQPQPQGGQMPQQGGDIASGTSNQNNAMQNAMPNRMQGGGDVARGF